MPIVNLHVTARSTKINEFSKLINRIKVQLPGFTVVQKLNQGSPRPLGSIKWPVPFFGTFLGKQKSTEE
jgi:hypothetical protein